MEMSDRGVLEYCGGDKGLKILQNREMRRWKLQALRARVDPLRNGSKDRSQAQQRREWNESQVELWRWVLREQSPPGKATVQVEGIGWAGGRSLLRSKDNIHPEPRPLLARWFRRSLSICSSVNYPVLPPACPLWWQLKQLPRNSICFPVLLPSTAHQHFRTERYPISLGLGMGAGSVPWWSWPQAPTSSPTHTNKTLAEIPKVSHLYLPSCPCISIPYNFFVLLI